MKFNKTKIGGVFLIDLEKHEDSRGFLTRIYGDSEFKECGIDFTITQSYITKSNKKGTIRGFHYLKVPEKKLTKVLRGKVFEVVIDIRPKSKTFKQWETFELKGSDYKMIYMDPGIAHAILTLEDDTEFMSLYSPEYSGENEGGIRYNDPTFNINWPIGIKHISVKDSSWENFK